MKPILPYFLIVWSILACGGLTNSGIGEANVRVTGLPQFVCPSSTPRPTHTMIPTQVQPVTATQAIYSTPFVYVTSTPSCSNTAPLSYQYVCIPNVCLYGAPSCGMFYTRPTLQAIPPGMWTGGGVGYGATSTPRPTYTPYPTKTPYPTATPYVLSENYHMGADVYVGSTEGLQLRFRVDKPQVIPISATQQVVVWEVEVGNIGGVPYHSLPGAQVFVSHLIQGGETISGKWFASREAAQYANITLKPETLDIVSISGGQSVNMTLTAFTPVGQVYKIGWILDPYSGGVGEGQVGGNTALWINEADIEGCDSNVGDGFIIPTPSAQPHTPTPSVTPYIKPYTGWQP